MRLGLAYDTETTDKPIWGEPSEGEAQPHIVQLAAKLVDLDTQEVINQMNMLVKPDGWVSSDESLAVHGISQETGLELGIDEGIVVLGFFQMWQQALELDPEAIRIGHNETFDRRIIRIATLRIPSLIEFAEPWKDLPKDRSFCTMHKSRKSCDLGKPPTLTEAYEHFTGEQFVNAHDAMADVDGCLTVYWAIQFLGEGV